MELTAKQEAFANLYALGNITVYEAMIKAGYSKTTALARGKRTYENVGVQKAIEQRKHEIRLLAESPTATLTPELIMNRTAALALQNENPSAAVSALRLGADILGMTQGNNAALPQGLDNFLGALAEGLSNQQRRRVEALPTEEPRGLEGGTA